VSARVDAPCDRRREIRVACGPESAEVLFGPERLLECLLGSTLIREEGGQLDALVRAVS